jgi:hypothetical protein
MQSHNSRPVSVIYSQVLQVDFSLFFFRHVASPPGWAYYFHLSQNQLFFITLVFGYERIYLFNDYH